MGSRLLLRLSTICVLMTVLGHTASNSAAEPLTDGESLLKAMIAWEVNVSTSVNFTTWVGDDFCTWEHVECNNASRVVFLNLSNTGVTGPIPQEIGNLIYLETLDLNNPRNAKPPLNQVTGNLSALQTLTNLKSLNLSFNNVILDTFPQVVLNLKKLVHLRLDNNHITSQLPKELTELTQLEYLYLGNNSMSGPLPTEFSTFTNLKELSLWGNYFNSIIPTEFGNLTNLEYLNLHDCHLYGGLPSEIGNLVNIKNISLYSNYLTGPIPDSWKNLKKLYNLWLYRNYLTKKFPVWINEIPTLTNLSLDWNYFYGSLPTFTNVTVKIVTVKCNFFSDTAPSSLQTIVLNTSGNCFTNFVDTATKTSCGQFYSCATFSEAISSGNCPVCPQSQTLVNSSTCVCTVNPAAGQLNNESVQVHNSHMHPLMPREGPCWVTARGKSLKHFPL